MTTPKQGERYTCTTKPEHYKADTVGRVFEYEYQNSGGDHILVEEVGGTYCLMVDDDEFSRCLRPVPHEVKVEVGSWHQFTPELFPLLQAGRRVRAYGSSEHTLQSITKDEPHGYQGGRSQYWDTNRANVVFNAKFAECWEIFATASELRKPAPTSDGGDGAWESTYATRRKAELESDVSQLKFIRIGPVYTSHDPGFEVFQHVPAQDVERAPQPFDGPCYGPLDLTRCEALPPDIAARAEKQVKYGRGLGSYLCGAMSDGRAR